MHARLQKLLVGLSTLALLAVPLTTTAFASPAPQPFRATGNLCLAELPEEPDPGDIQPLGPTGAVITFGGEVLEGTVDDSTWDALDGAGLTVTIDREVSYFNFAGGTFTGRIEGTIEIDGAEELEGGFSGVIQGSFDPGAEDLLSGIYRSSPRVQWSAEEDDVNARGMGNATFAPTEEGFCGDISLTGTHS